MSSLVNLGLFSGRKNNRWSVLKCCQECWEMVEEIVYFSGSFVDILIWASFRYKLHVVEVMPQIPRKNSPTDCKWSQIQPMAERWKSSIIKMLDADWKKLYIFSWWHISGFKWCINPGYWGIFCGQYSSQLRILVGSSLFIKKNVTDLCCLHDSQAFMSSVLDKQSLVWIPIAPICCCLIFPKMSLRVELMVYQMLGNGEQLWTDEQACKKNWVTAKELNKMGYNFLFGKRKK